MTQFTRRAAYGVLHRTVRRMFRRVEWIGRWNPPPTGRPTVIYSNHHAFYDGLILGLFCERVLHRPPVVWVEDLDRFPFFSLLGALRFPSDDPAGRTATIRRTVRLMRRQPSTVMVYFPEGHLHAVEEGIAAFPAGLFHRLARLFDTATWWPIALHVTGWHHAWPTALLCGGSIHEHPTGHERETLERLLQQLHDHSQAPRKLLFEGRASPHERWDMSWMQRLFPGGRW